MAINRSKPWTLYQPPPPWPGITSGFDAYCGCTWAFHQGVYQVKYLHGNCLNHFGRKREAPDADS